MSSPDRIDFTIPDSLKQKGISRIAKERGMILIERNPSKRIIVTIKPDWTKMINDLRKRAENYFDENIVNEIETVVTNHYLEIIDGKGAGDGAEDTSKGGNTDGKRNQKGIKQYEVMKYSGNGSITLSESIRLGDDFLFVSYQNGNLKFTEQITATNMLLNPYSGNALDHYAFKDERDLLFYISRAKNENLDTLWKKVYSVVEAFNDTDEVNLSIITADIIFTYFADRIGMTHYLFAAGPSGTGKGSILETFHQLGYRAVLITNANAPNIYRLLGSVEKGQVTILIDEANNIENDITLLETCKTGYKGSGKVPRMLDASSSSSEQVFYNTFSFKFIAAEHLPAEWKAEGFLNRCLPLKTYPGVPAYSIDKVVENADDPKLKQIFAQLQYVRKLLFAYRLIHYSEPILDIRLNITGRDEELASPLLRLFRNAKVIDKIRYTLYHFLSLRKDAKADSFDAFVCRMVIQLLQQKNGERGTHIDRYDNDSVAFATIWHHLRNALSGEDVPDKPQTMMTNLYGEVSFKRIAHILNNLGGRRDKDSTATLRIWRFDKKKLERFAKAYERVASIEILDQSGLDTFDTSDTLWKESIDSITAAEEGVENEKGASDKEAGEEP